MRGRGDRAVQELYAATERLAEPKITPVLEGIYRMQGPIDESEVAHQKPKLDNLPVEKGSTSVNQNPLNKPESGTCNICSAPCSSCSHRNRALPVMGSNTPTTKEEDSFSCVGASEPVDKSKSSDDHEHASSETGDILSSKSLVGEQHWPECHSDDISCISAVKDAHNVAVNKTDTRSAAESSESLPSNIVEKVIKNEYAVDNCNARECQVGSGKPITCSEDSIRNRTPSSNFTEVGPSRNSADEFPPSSSIPKEHRSLSNSQDNSKDSKDPPEKACSQPPDEGPESLMENETLSPSEKAADASIGMQIAPGFQHNGTDPEFANEVMKCEATNDGCQKINLENAPNDPRKTSTVGKSSGEVKDDVADVQEKTSSSDSEEVEDDVKVCDICGDLGQEEKLAICTRCNDGAEHTYCMRVKLDEVPEGEWLCEECQKEVESEKHKKEKTQAKIGVSKASPVVKTEKLASTVNLEGSAKQSEARNLDSKGSNKVIQGSNIATKGKDEDLEIASFGRQKLPEVSGGSTDATDSRKKMLLSRESSFKLDVDKAKQASGQMPNSVVSNSPKNQAPPLRGPLSKSVSFNNSKVPKVKQLINEVPQKARNLKESSSNLRKEGPSKTITKSASFKNVNYNETANKTKSSNLPNTEEPRGMKSVIEKNLMNSRSTSILGRPSVSPSMATPVPPKTDLVAAQHLTKANNIADSNNFGIGQGSSRSSLGYSELNKPYLTKAPGSTSTNGADRSFNIPGSATQKRALQTSDPSHRDDKIKDPSSLRQVVSNSSRTTRCQRCNEAGHSTQFCAVDKLRMSAVRPLCDRNLKEGIGKRNKLRDADEATALTTNAQVGSRSADQSEHILKSGLDHNSAVKSKGILSTSFSHVKKSPLLDVRTGEQEMRSSLAAPSNTSSMICNKQKSEHQETVCVSQGRNANFAHTMSDELKDTAQIFSSRAFALTDGLTASTIPELEFIWQGGFELLRTGRSPELCDGLQAHLSSSASPKVLETVTHFPCKVQLEEVPRQKSWPLQFQEHGPTEDNIGLFFFARDIQSYENHYSKLVENMLKNDLVLRGNVQAVELLIFPSNLLPKNCQRWNKLYFLWGVFRVRWKDCVKDLSDLHEKPCESDLNKDVIVANQNIPVLSSGVPLSQNLNDSAKLGAEVPKFDMLPDPNALKSSETEHPSCSNGEISSFQKSARQTPRGKQAEDLNHGPILINSSSKNSSEIPYFLTSLLARKDQKKAAASEQEDITRDSSHAGDEEMLDVNRVPAVCSVSLSHEEGDESTVGTLNKMESFVKSNALLDDQQEDFMDIDYTSGTSKRNIEIANWVCKADDIKEHKKMKLDSGAHANSSLSEGIKDGRLSSKIQPLAASSMGESLDNGAIPGRSNGAEKFVFPVDLNAVESTTPGSFINVLYSDDEELPERDAPDLELALGDKRSPKKASEKVQTSKSGSESEGNLPDKTKNKSFPIWQL